MITRETHSGTVRTCGVMMARNMDTGTVSGQYHYMYVCMCVVSYYLPIEAAE